MNKQMLTSDMPDNLRQFALNHPAWVRFQTDADNADIFHLPAWATLLAECYGFKPYTLGVIAGVGQEETIVAGLPFLEVNSHLTGKRLIALPFSDFCIPLGDEQYIQALTRGLQDWRVRNRWPRLVVHWPLPSGDGIYWGETTFRHTTHLSSDHQSVFRTFKKTQIQQSIRQAQKAGVVIQRVKSWDAMQKFYMLHVQTRRRLGSPVQPIRFFRLLWERLISQGFGFVMLAYKDTQVIAGAVFLHRNKTLTYKYSASDSSCWNMRPNHLLLWHAIQWGCEQGYQVFDWGKTDPDNEGLRAFKSGWGSEEQILHYSVLADKPPLDNLTGGTKQRVLANLIQNSPAWVCRIIGELFYKYAA